MTPRNNQGHRVQLPPMPNGRIKAKARKLAERYHGEGRPITEILYRVQIEFRYRDARVRTLAQNTAAEYLRSKGMEIR